MRLYLLHVTLWLVLPLAFSCTDDHVDSKVVREEMAQRRLFRITETQLLTGAQAVGLQTIIQLDSVQNMANGNDSLTCVQALAPLLATLRTKEITATRIAFDSWEPKKDLPKVQEVLDALKYTHTQGQPIPANLQKDGQQGFHYVAAITVGAKTCLSCHSGWKVGQEVGIYNLRYGSRPAAQEASKGLKGMN